MTDCIFCKIIAGEIPSSKLYEDNHVYCFLDINPVTPGHSLVIPKKHFEFLSDMEPEYAAPMWEAGRKIAAALRKADIKCDGVNFLLADGSAAGQEVGHVHLHIIARSPGDGAGYKFDPNRKRPDDDEWKRIAESISSNV